MRSEKTNVISTVRHFFRSGGMGSSIFALIIICLGAGTLSIPYVFYANGILIGTFLVIFGGCLSLYTGFLVVLSC